VIYWEFGGPEVEAAGARPPEPMDLDYGRLPPGDPRPHGIDLQRAALAGRKVTPADCPPIRVISRYGFMLRSPGAVDLRRVSPPARWREFAEDSSSYGSVRVAGDRWPEGDSGFVASWISGSDFVKIHTGIRLWYPADHLLMTGPLPNLTELNGSVAGHAVMAGLEYSRPDHMRDIDGESHARAVLNIVVKIPDLPGECWAVPAGEPLAWLVVLPKKQRMARL
jgi:hypothetical protein